MTESPALTQAPPAIKGKISEIFSSLQGEGLFVGERQIFIRLAGCPWRCRYCDTPGSLFDEGHQVFSVEEVLDRVHDLQEKQEHKTVSLTGGEPLIQADFLAALLPALKRLDRRTYLETSGTHPHLLAKIIGDVDVVAMDVKLPSAIGRPFWKEHEEFLKIAGVKAFVKLVLTAQTTEEEMEQTANLLTMLNPVPTLVIQPVTPIVDLDLRLQDVQSPSPLQILPPPPARVVAWWEWAKQRLPNVKLTPQMHPYWGLP